MDPDKVKSVLEFPVPRNKKELQSFLGFCNFYRKFSSKHSSIVQPLSHLLKKGVLWKFGEKENIAFQQIKETLSNSIQLTHPNFNMPFNIQTDASLIGLGAELFQINEINERDTIAFASRTLVC